MLRASPVSPEAPRRALLQRLHHESIKLKPHVTAGRYQILHSWTEMHRPNRLGRRQGVEADPDGELAKAETQASVKAEEEVFT